jgi:hypothetical protein
MTKRGIMFGFSRITLRIRRFPKRDLASFEERLRREMN